MYIPALVQGEESPLSILPGIDRFIGLTSGIVTLPVITRYVARLAHRPPPKLREGNDPDRRPPADAIRTRCERQRDWMTTLLRWISEISLRNGASAILDDVDPSNASYMSHGC